MSMQLREVEAFLRGKEAEELANRTGDLALELEARNLTNIREDRDRKSRAAPKDAEWRRQTDNFIRVGYWKELDYKDPESYRQSVPRFAALPKEYRGKLAHHLAVEGRIPHERKLELLKIPSFITGRVTNEIDVPDAAYTVHTCPPVLFRGTYAEALRQIPDYAIGSPMTEVDDAYLNLYSQYPEYFASWTDAGNSRYGAGNVPYLRVGGNRPRVDAGWVDDPDGRWRVLFRGKNIGT